MKRDKLLDEAKNLVNGPRARDYGDAYENHERVAQLWSTILGQDVSVSQVYQCLMALKLARLIVSPTHTDSWVDIAGYASLGGEIDGKGK
tara:strand:- start:43 stop:312 length:270 start_codon:yes stop_codon:yes gene_type:complete